MARNPFAPSKVPALPKIRNTQMPKLPTVKPNLPGPVKSPTPVFPPTVTLPPPSPMPTPVQQASNPNDISQGKLQRGGFVPGLLSPSLK